MGGTQLTLTGQAGADTRAEIDWARSGARWKLKLRNGAPPPRLSLTSNSDTGARTPMDRRTDGPADCPSLTVRLGRPHWLGSLCADRVSAPPLQSTNGRLPATPDRVVTRPTVGDNSRRRLQGGRSQREMAYRASAVLYKRK